MGYLGGRRKPAINICLEYVHRLFEREYKVVPEVCGQMAPCLEQVAAGMDLPGFRLHPLKGALRGQYAVSVSGNWRVTFRFEDGHAVDVDYVDYH